jgi:hypothetical protein
LASAKRCALANLPAASNDREAAKLDFEQLDGERVVRIDQWLVAGVMRPKIGGQKARIEVVVPQEIAQGFVKLFRARWMVSRQCFGLFQAPLERQQFCSVRVHG